MLDCLLGDDEATQTGRTRDSPMKFRSSHCTFCSGLVRAVSVLVTFFAMCRALSLKSRAFLYHPLKSTDAPKLIIIGGCPGTGKSTFGMSLALDQGILKCISTDTVRAVMRSYVPEDISPALHRSSYAPSTEDASDSPVKSWKETCKVLESSLEGLVDDAINRGVSLVLEGVSIAPSNKWIDKWTEAGGVACGVLLTVMKEESHKSLLMKRGFITGNQEAEQDKLKSIDRVRKIQDEMVQLAHDSDWLLIEQKLEPDPLEIVQARLTLDEDCLFPSAIKTKLESMDAVNSTKGPDETHSIDGTRLTA